MRINKQNLKILILAIVLLTFVLALIVSLLNIQKEPEETEKNETEEIDSENNLPKTTIYPVENKSEIKGLFKLKEPYFINAIVLYHDSELFNCLTPNKECKVYHISDGENTWYLSENETVQVYGFADEAKQKFNIKDSEVELRVVKLDMFDDENNVVTDNEGNPKYVILQAYGCIQNKICASTGNLSISKSENSVKNFINFINSIEF